MSTTDTQQYTTNQQQYIKRLNRVAWVITILVWLLVGAMRRIKFDTGMDLSFLAGLNALFNTGVTIALLTAYYFIRRKKITQHRKSIYVAMILSAGFLLSYVAYHFTTEEIVFCKEGWMRSAYYFILFSHILLAGLSLPFILLRLSGDIPVIIQPTEKWPDGFFQYGCMSRLQAH